MQPRSQIAETILNRKGRGGFIHAIQVLRAGGIDWAGHQPRGLEGEVGLAGVEGDAV
jgi:hypothetical protein